MPRSGTANALRRHYRAPDFPAGLVFETGGDARHLPWYHARAARLLTYDRGMANGMVEEVDRTWPTQWADDELRLMWEFLTFLRITAVNKVAGLDRELVATAPLKTSPVMTLLGVIKHLTAAEREWLSIVGGGSDLPSLWVQDPEADWRLTDEDTPQSVTEAYQREWAYSEEALRGKAAGDRAAVTVNGRDRTVRWLLAHLVQETARHVGHMDLLREMADGSKGE